MNSRFDAGKRAIKFFKILSPFFDVLLSPLTITAAIWFRIARYWGIKSLPITRKIFLQIGMFPIVAHYYEPLFDYRKIKPNSPISNSKWLSDPQIQVDFLKSLKYAKELIQFPMKPASESEYYYDNGSFGSGDSELYYSIIRKIKPEKIVEVGSGFSTRMALHAIAKNKEEDSGYSCLVTCIEPYEMPWLEKMNVELLRKNVEDIKLDYFNRLQEGDILFIDSSHIIRPGGDINFLILKVLPRINKGVWVHFHDIFTPDEYPINWIREEFRMWNEQYLLEAFLINNEYFEVKVAMNFINKNSRNKINGIFPVLSMDGDRNPGSFWIRKIK